MILVTGGLGFIGLHTARSLLDLGEGCVLTQYRVARAPNFIAGEIGERVHVEQLDVTNTDMFLALGKKYEITGIVHLAVPGIGALDAFEDCRVNTQGLLNALQAATEWRVRRVTIGSSIGVYPGVPEIPWQEARLPLTTGSATETFKKTFELLTAYVAGRTGLEAVNLRIAGIYGPLYHSMANLPSRLVHAAVHGTEPDLAPPRPPAYTGNGSDICYVRDVGRAIALAQTAEHLEHRTYNIGQGRVTTNGEVLAAVQAVIPSFTADLPTGRNPDGPAQNGYLDTSRFHEATGFEPEFDITTAIADYIAWLRAGNAE